jgi:small subunit ribosomal protein S20
MAHHKSAKKRIRTSEKKRVVNKNAISQIKTLTKKVFSSENKTEAESVYKEAVSVLDRNVSKGRLHKNTASRKKSALTKHVNNLNVAVTEAPVKKEK